MIQKSIVLLVVLVLFYSCGNSGNQVANSDTTDDIWVIARLDVQPGSWEKFENIAKQCKEAVEAKDKGTLRYDWYFNEAKTECVVIEHYIDSDAVLEHSANAGAIVGQLLEYSTLSLEVYGDPSPDLQKAFEGRGINFYKALFK